jgi:hypothetical protein
MLRNLTLSVVLLLLSASMALAQAAGQSNKQPPAEAKELSGMSIVGNDEAPKSLYIVPWKSSELGVETSLRMLADSGAKPLDREVFLRQLAYYQVSIGEERDPR